MSNTSEDISGNWLQLKDTDYLENFLIYYTVIPNHLITSDSIKHFIIFTVMLLVFILMEVVVLQIIYFHGTQKCFRMWMVNAWFLMFYVISVGAIVGRIIILCKKHSDV